MSRQAWVAVRVTGVLVMSGAIAALGNSASAQITPDTTLGLERSVVTPNVMIRGLPSSQITGGSQRGANLFHSFQEFNIGAGMGAYFANPTGIENILTRVTGSNPSNILGTLGVLGNANLFLLNPNGIIFGRTASLDLKGSFVATTANAIGFDLQGTFSATTPGIPPLLTVQPSAFLFNQIAAQSIVNKSSTGLQVANDRSLLLLGGALNVEGGKLIAPGGKIELGGLAAAGVVALNGNGGNLNLSFPVGVQRADVSLIGATVDVTAGGGGSIAIDTRNLEILGISSLSGGIQSGLGSAGVSAGNITLNATGAITIQDFSSIRNDINVNAMGNGGDINIKAGSLSVSDGAFLSASTLGKGNAGNINIDVSDNVTLAEVDNNTAAARGIATIVLPGAIGNGGDINIKARSFSINNGSGVSTSTLGGGNAGDISINVSDFVNIAGVSADGTSSASATTTEATASGHGGNITLNTGYLRVADGAVLSARTRSANNGGNITVDANILDLVNGGQLFTTTFSSGQAGNILIRANDSITISGSDSTIIKDRLAQQDYFRLIPVAPASGVFSNTTLNSKGDGGNISISTNNLNIINNAQISAQSFGTGNAGKIDINASGNEGDNLESLANSIYLDNQGAITATSLLSEGGNISIQTDSLQLRHNSQIIATAGLLGSAGNGGNININTKTAVVIENSNIEANAFKGQGGNISISTQGLFLSPDSAITASSLLGVNGVVRINTPSVNPSLDLVTLPFSVVDASRLIAQGCSTPNSLTRSRFVVTAQGGLPPNPGETLTSDAVWEDLRTEASSAKNNSTTTTITSSDPDVPLVEATGWEIDERGVVTLTAPAPTATTPGLTQKTCGAR